MTDNSPKLVSLHTTANIILNHVRENCMPSYMNIEHIYSLKIVKTLLKYTQNSNEFEFYKNFIIPLTNHTCGTKKTIYVITFIKLSTILCNLFYIH